MLFDRCLMTKHDGDWIGLVELRQRSGEHWRFLAWIAAAIAVIEGIRLGQSSFAYFNRWELALLILSLILAAIAFKNAGKLIAQRAVLFKLPPPRSELDDDGLLIGQKQTILLARNEGFESFDRNRFSHVVFGLIDYPLPGRANVTIEAYAIYLAEHDGSPQAVLEGAFDKFSTYMLARRLAALTKLPLIEMGKGHPFKDDLTLKNF